MTAETFEDPRMAALAQAIAESRPRAATAASSKVTGTRRSRRWIAVSLSVLALGAAVAGAALHLKRDGPDAQVAAALAPRKPSGIVMGPLADMPEIRDGVVAIAPTQPRPAPVAPARPIDMAAAAPPPPAVIASSRPAADQPVRSATAASPVRVVPMGPTAMAAPNASPQTGPSSAPATPPRVTSASVAGESGAAILASAAVARPLDPAPAPSEQPPPTAEIARAEPGPLLRPTDPPSGRAAAEPPRPPVGRPRPEVAGVSADVPARRPERAQAPANRPRTAEAPRPAPSAPRAGNPASPATPPAETAEPDDRVEVLGVRIPNGRDIQDGVRSIGEAVIDLPRRIIPGG